MVQDGFAKATHLYAYAQAVSSRCPCVFLVEGPIDALSLLQAGYPAVASFGVDFSVQQAKLLAQIGKPVVVAFDNDVKGRTGSARAFHELSKTRCAAFEVTIPKPFKDPAEIPRDQLQTWLQSLVPQAA